MYKLYFTLAFKNLIKNYQNTLILLIGLTLGLGSSLFIFLFYHLETNYDNFYSEDIYRTKYKVIWDNETIFDASANFPEGTTYQENIDNIKAYTIVKNPSPKPIFIEGIKYDNIKVTIADTSYFSFFEIPLLKGNLSTAFQDKNNIIVSESFAKTHFGNNDPIGRKIDYYGHPLLIAGVMPNLPANSHLQFDLLISTNWLQSTKSYLGWWGGTTFNLYLKFRFPEQIETSLKQINAILLKKYESDDDEIFIKTASLQPIQDIHLESANHEYDLSTNRSKESLWLITSLGLIILPLALLNFIVLYTAQKDEEIHTLSLMKIYGAHHKDLILSTCIEIAMLIGVTIITSILLLQLCIPFLNDKLNSSVYLSNYIPLIIIFYLILGGFLTVLLSSLSLRGIKSISLASSLNGLTGIFSSKGIGEKAILIFQFSIVFILSLLGLTIYQQYKYLTTADLGFEHKNLFAIELMKSVDEKNLVSFKEEVLKIAGVENVSLTSNMLGKGLTQNGYYVGLSKKFPNAYTLLVDENFFDTFDLNIEEGTTFNDNKVISDHQYIVNKAFTKLEGWEGIGTIVERQEKKFEVTGIIKPFIFNKLTNVGGPLVITTNAKDEKWSDYYYINIKLNTSSPYPLAQKINDLWKKEFPDVKSVIHFYDEALIANYQSIKGQQNTGIFFGIITFLIAISGLWGITRFSVLKRTKEVSIRRVNGASRKQIILLFNQYFVQWIILSFLIAIPIANHVGNEWLSSFPNRVHLNYFYWFIFGGCILLLSSATITKICWKVVNTNPSEVLRDL